VLFNYKPEATEDDKRAVIRNCLALKDNCKNPTTGEPYILSLEAGKNFSKETNVAFEHAYVIHFANEADRQYYLYSDQAHKAWEGSLQAVDRRVAVFDFVPGKF